MPKQKISLREKILQWTSKKDLYEIKSTREMFFTYLKILFFVVYMRKKMSLATA
jgi:hypothetical protein